MAGTAFSRRKGGCLRLTVRVCNCSGNVAGSPVSSHMQCPSCRQGPEGPAAGRGVAATRSECTYLFSF